MILSRPVTTVARFTVTLKKIKQDVALATSNNNTLLKPLVNRRNAAGFEVLMHTNFKCTVSSSDFDISSPWYVAIVGICQTNPDYINASIRGFCKFLTPRQGSQVCKNKNNLIEPCLI